jgi:hypothetical protein
MLGQHINRVSLISLVVLSLIALLCVLSGIIQPPQPQTDEGVAAHIFQLSLALFLPATLLYLATADWSRSFRSARMLALPFVTMMAACGALYYLEHFMEHIR